jgi:acyl-[acyl-carrier-protein]-phospholipid O-acyltransferase/long-chain-fatty-acid--[acyl-carrier-protein] ligase
MDAAESQTESAEATQPQLRGFWSLIATQFEGAFNDNALKMLVTYVGLNMALSPWLHKALVPLTAGLFSLPFLLFSMTGGFFADRFSKRSVTIGVKLLEIVIMSFATLGLLQRSLAMGLAAIFLMGVHSSIFGPSKYGMLPELLPERRLSWGNGILELGTFLAIILGMAGGALLYKRFEGRQECSGAVMIGLALLGFGFSLGISRLRAANPTKPFQANFLGDLWQQVQMMRRDRVLWLANLGNIYFWFIGQLLQQAVIDYGVDVLKVGEIRTMYMLAALAVGIGLGSFAAGYLSGGKIEYGLVPLGAVGITVFAAILWNPHLHFSSILGVLSALGFFAGFFIVPISAILQHRPSRQDKGIVLAAANLLSSAGLFVAAGVYWVLAVGLGLGPRGVFGIGGLLTLAATFYVLWLLPDSFLRFMLWALTHTIYRIRVLGRDNIPSKGGALFVCNHLSFVDAMLLLASTDRPVRFLVYKGMYEKPWIKPFAKTLGAIPISSEQRPREMLHALHAASEAIRAGEVVCIFAEGQITRIGNLLPFRRGFERIMKDVEAPIVPVGLDGVWGSIFSFDRGRFLWKLPRRIPYRVTVNFGQPLPHTAAPFEVRERVQELLAEAWEHRKAHMEPLHRSFVRTARRHPFRLAMTDPTTPKLTFGSALMRTIFLGRRLKKVWDGQEMVGLLLPPSVPGALVNFAAVLMGKVPVNLNYTVSAETLQSCISQCRIKTVLTSRVFLEKLKLKVPAETVLLEELMGRSADILVRASAQAGEGGPTPGERTEMSALRFAGPPTAVEKLCAMLSAWLLPVGWLERMLGRQKPAVLDDLVTVIFSSGSTGEPKGVMLSHYNIGSNIEQLEQVFGLDASDGFVGVLPFFHSFGSTGTLWLPAVLGVRAAYYPNPLEAKAIGPLVSQHALTFLLATPTFLQLYMRSCSAEDFGSLRLVMTGAEKLPERLASAFEEQFGVRPLEGYGCTECSPAVAVNTYDFRSAGFRQVGAKRGKIGHPLPGMSVRIVDAETFRELPVGEPGLMLVHGPNVMQGYLGRPDKTAEALHDGWYVTGDIAAIDQDGFLQITDRLSRFSKIGGEMVPHIKIEERLHEFAGATEQVFLVAGVPDEKKGERLVVLHKLAQPQLVPCLEKLAQCDLPNLWKPRADQFFHIDALPYLGTGKLDLRKAREIAIQASGAAT